MKKKSPQIRKCLIILFIYFIHFAHDSFSKLTFHFHLHFNGLMFKFLAEKFAFDSINKINADDFNFRKVKCIFGLVVFYLNENMKEIQYFLPKLWNENDCDIIFVHLHYTSRIIFGRNVALGAIIVSSLKCKRETRPWHSIFFGS